MATKTSIPLKAWLDANNFSDLDTSKLVAQGCPAHKEGTIYKVFTMEIERWFYNRYVFMFDAAVITHHRFFIMADIDMANEFNIVTYRNGRFIYVHPNNRSDVKFTKRSGPVPLRIFGVDWAVNDGVLSANVDSPSAAVNLNNGASIQWAGEKKFSFLHTHPR